VVDCLFSQVVEFQFVIHVTWTGQVASLVQVLLQVEDLDLCLLAGAAIQALLFVEEKTVGYMRNPLRMGGRTRH
jgi:hypothetical protein